MSFGSEMGESPPLTYGEGPVVLAAGSLHTEFGPIELTSTHFSGKYLFSVFMHIFWALQFRCSPHLQLGHGWSASFECLFSARNIGCYLIEMCH